MGVKIGTTSGYFWLDSWVMANIIQLGTISFCRRFLNKNSDPCGRQFDQMTQAARSGQAHIAEGASRHQMSSETEMKLTDVSRANISELASDYMVFLMSYGQSAWPNKCDAVQNIRQIRLDKPVYTDELLHDVTAHIIKQKNKFDPWIESADAFVAANAMLILCARLNSMLTAQIERCMKEFKVNGGFKENMTRERLDNLKRQNADGGAPECPRCGKPMIRRTAKKGRNSGNEFWSCSDYPECVGSLPIGKQH